MINFTNANFVKSSTCKEEKPQGRLPEVLICGRSNVGKSSLINALTNHTRLAYTSSKPGHTRLLNFFNIDNKFLLVDAPGYGYAKGGVVLDALFGEMMSSYIFDNNELKLILILLDSRRELTDNDREIITLAKEENIPYRLVVTKTDKINQSEKAKLLKSLKEEGIEVEKVFQTSALDRKGTDKLKKEIEKCI